MTETHPLKNLVSIKWISGYKSIIFPSDIEPNQWLKIFVNQLVRSITQTRTRREGGGSFMRVRVTLNVYQPLCRGHAIKLEEGSKVWVNFKYERLPNICYWCGCFDHSDKDCDLWIQSKGTLHLLLNSLAHGFG